MKVVSFLQAEQQKLSTCAAEETIESVAKRLSALNIGALPVCGLNNALVGVISERDVVRGMAKDGCKLAERRVRDLMTREVRLLRPDHDHGGRRKADVPEARAPPAGG